MGNYLDRLLKTLRERANYVCAYCGERSILRSDVK